MLDSTAQPKTQRAAVKLHLKTGAEISSMEAFNDYGITRLAVCINLLRNAGMIINREDRKFTSKYGFAGSYGVYTLKKEEDNE